MDIGIVLEGEATHLIGGEKQRLIRGDIYCVPPHIPHSLINHGKLRICDISFYPDVIAPWLSGLREVQGFKEFISLRKPADSEWKFKAKMHLTPEDMAFIEERIFIMWNEDDLLKPGYRLMLKTELVELIVILSRLFHSYNQAVSINYSRLSGAISYIRKHYLQQISRKDLATLCKLSPSHFDRLFRKMYKVSPKEYIIQLRLQQAKKLLQEPGRTIVQVAHETGFQDSNFFSRLFKKHFNITPSTYRGR